MNPKTISFNSADVLYTPKQKNLLRRWMYKICTIHHCNLVQVDFIFCSDIFLLQINRQFLNHNTFTDIITFDYASPLKAKLKPIQGEIYISTERVKENAKTYQTTYSNEMHRVMIHGVLHLCGFKDKKNADQKEMRLQEEKALQVLKRLL